MNSRTLVPLLALVSGLFGLQACSSEGEAAPEAGIAEEPPTPAADAAVEPPAPKAFTVRGHVRGARLAPVGDAQVVITGKAPATTAADGSFVIEDVEGPYDITVVQKRARVRQTSAPTRQSPHTFEGIRTATPTLTAQLDDFVAQRRASLTVRFAAVRPGTQVIACVEGVSGAVYGCATAYEENPSPTLEAKWDSTPTASARPSAW